ncbi:3-deoxy-manno-octulosonate cytidylyltransferase [candidate division KSB1 bacterium]
MKVLGVIPARFNSKRFPGKPLSLILNKPMIQHVFERSMLAKKLNKVVVATDDKRIYDAVKDFEGEVVMTDENIHTGTDRVYHASKALDYEIVLNIQGDEPLIEPELLDLIVEEFEKEIDIDVVTPIRKAETIDEVKNPNMARVVIDKNGFALYFSRAAIPYNRDLSEGKWLDNHTYYKHIGIYGYRKVFLEKFVNMGTSGLENVEKLEQLRILENGYRIKTVLTVYNPVCVDLPEDIKNVERVMKERHH